MNARIPCLVPFCGRTAPAHRYPVGFEIICSTHWRLVSPATKARRRRIDRLAGKIDREFRRLYTAQGDRFAAKQWSRVEKARHLSNLIWRKCKAEAIEAAAGIA